jgi:acetylornithine deacetylase
VHAAGGPGRPSLVARHAGAGDGRSLLLNGHLDTGGVAGMADPFAGRIAGDRRSGRLLGRGACDMKAGVAAMVAAAETAAAAGTSGDVVLALVADEEHASLGTEAVLRSATTPTPWPTRSAPSAGPSQPEARPTWPLSVVRAITNG